MHQERLKTRLVVVEPKEVEHPPKLTNILTVTMFFFVVCLFFYNEEMCIDCVI